MRPGPLRPTRLLLLLLPTLVAPAARGDGFPTFRAQEIDPRVGEVCYAVILADVDGDGKPDIVAAASDAVTWYRNPTWAKADILRGRTERDNVCIQARDIDGDGRVDFALGAGWRPTDTKEHGTLQVLTRTGATVGEPWRVVPLVSEPTLHRVRWGDVLGSTRPQLVVAPLQGRGTKGPARGEGAGCRILVKSAPDDPFAAPWPTEVADDSLHTVHNLQVLDFDGDAEGRDEILLAAREGVFVLKRAADGKWSKLKIGEGSQDPKTTRGASEVKLGKLPGGGRFLATIEPWHGNQLVYYFEEKPGRAPWTRVVVAEPIAWGHAVWMADLDGDGDDDVVVGQRDPNKGGNEGPAKGPGVFAFESVQGASNRAVRRHAIDDGGIATEDLVAGDLDGDGRPEVVAGGRASHNLKIYWNVPIR